MIYELDHADGCCFTAIGLPYITQLCCARTNSFHRKWKIGIGNCRKAMATNYMMISSIIIRLITKNDLTIGYALKQTMEYMTICI